MNTTSRRNMKNTLSLSSSQHTTCTMPSLSCPHCDWLALISNQFVYCTGVHLHRCTGEHTGVHTHRLGGTGSWDKLITTTNHISELNEATYTPWKDHSTQQDNIYYKRDLHTGCIARKLCNLLKYLPYPANHLLQITLTTPLDYMSSCPIYL